jgi:carboxypeptidase Taq
VREPDAEGATNVRLLRRAYDRAVRLPRHLVEELARVTTLASQQWALARAQADFAAFAPWLERVVSLKIQQAQALGYEDSPYDALLEEYEPGARTRDIARLFTALRTDLAPLVSAIVGTRKRAPVKVLHGDFPIDRQRTYCEMVAGALGFDFQCGRLDTATHPFASSIGPGDCRITTRYNPHYFSDAFYCTLHEVGHGLYEQGLPAEHYGTPLGEATSVAIHESQARLWENLVGRSRSFWRHFFPLARQIFHEALGDVSLQRYHFAVNHVEPSLVRVRADEVTYNLHIVLRFELELALLSGDLKPADLPGAWIEAYRKTLGVVPANDAEGCLQDGHWAAGLIGYFPTYTLGNVIAAQLFAQAARDVDGLDRSMGRGDFHPLLDWLRDNIHRQGSRYGANDLVQRVTGAAPDPGALVADLRQRYGRLYGI